MIFSDEHKKYECDITEDCKMLDELDKPFPVEKKVRIKDKIIENIIVNNNKPYLF
jgi:hypothetical protein